MAMFVYYKGIVDKFADDSCVH